MADAEVKPMSTIIFFSTSCQDHVNSIETLVDAMRADERCAHKVCFRPIMTNVFQLIGGVLDKKSGMMTPMGAHEILYMSAPFHEANIERIKNTKNVVLDINCMCFVGDNDKKKKKVKKIIDWFLEETEEIEL